MNVTFAPSHTRLLSILGQNLGISVDAGDPGRAISLKPAAMSLLCEVLARLRGVEMPVVQFVPVCAEGGAAEVGGSLARASATCLGRTLLVRPNASQSQILRLVEDVAPSGSMAHRRTRRTVEEPFEIVPDSAISGLCHACFGCDPGDTSQSTHISADSWLNGVARDFRLIVIESDPPESNPATLELAARCQGSVLVVAAGANTLSQSRTIMRQIQLVGGTLIGSVLHGAPAQPIFSLFPRWLEPSAASVR